MKHIGLTAVVVAVFTGLCVASAAAAGGTLQGEQFTNSSYAFDLTSFSCDAAGGTVSFAASGDATGPYAGTYEAVVTFTSGPLDAPNGDQGYRYGQLTSAVETFTITSGSSIITGSKTLAQPGGEFICRTYPAAECTGLEFSVTTPQDGMAYTAAGGGVADYGTATTAAAAGGGGEGNAVDCAGSLYTFNGVFSQEFVSLAPKAPATAADCKEGGYAAFGDTFKNQGECVAFVEHATKQ